jgi:hypothetical protein
VYVKAIDEVLPGTDSYPLPGVMPQEVIDNNALPGDIRVDYLDVNDTETASFVRRIRSKCSQQPHDLK